MRGESLWEYDITKGSPHKKENWKMTKLKKYGTIYSKLSFVRIVNGKRVVINFDNGGCSGKAKYGTYVTSNEGIQNAIESHKNFVKKGVGEIFLMSETEISTPKVLEPEEEKPLKEIPSVESVKDAIEILTGEPYNLKAASVNTKAKAEAKAKDLGLSFPNLK